jgi:hypothetical protein
VVTLHATGVAWGVNIPTAGKKFSATKNLNSGKETLKSNQKDLNIAYGGIAGGTNLSGTLEVYYADTPSNLGTVTMPPPWASNNGTVAKYKNSLAPGGPSLVKSATVATAKIAKVSSKGLGGLNLASAPGPGGIITILTIASAGGTFRHCTQYSTVTHKVTASGQKLSAKGGAPITCPASCSDGVQNGGETDVDCGGATTCPRCGTGDSCGAGSDCQSGVCLGGICLAPTCIDGVQNGSETGVDCGGGCPSGCGFGNGCNTNPDCDTGLSCVGGICRCNNNLFTFTTFSNVGGVFDSAEWPGGTQAQSNGTGCNVTINNPDNNIDLVCTLAGPFSVNTFNGYSNCFGTGGEDGDGCQPVSCPPVGIGSCCMARPSCSAALNGAGSAQYFVQCLQ